MKNDTRTRRKVSPEVVRRKRRFAAALALAGIRQCDFAEQQGVDPGHLSKVLNGERESLSLLEKVDGFTDRWLGKLAAA